MPYSDRDKGAAQLRLATMQSQEQLCTELLAFENQLLNTLASHSEARLARLRAAAEHIKREVLSRQERGTLSPSTCHLGARVGQRLERLAGLLRSQESETVAMRTMTQNELLLLLQRTPSLQETPNRGDRGETALNASRMRTWFLHNLGYPFPTRDDKLQILEDTNAEAKSRTDCLVYNQAVLWFINTRRRSGWTRFLRSYAGDDKAKMLQIAWALQNEEPDEDRIWYAGPLFVQGMPHRVRDGRTVHPRSLRHVFPEASERFLNDLRSDWYAVVERVKIGVKERVGDWIDEVLRLSDTGHEAQEQPRPTTRRASARK